MTAFCRGPIFFYARAQFSYTFYVHMYLQINCPFKHGFFGDVRASAARYKNQVCEISEWDDTKIIFFGQSTYENIFVLNLESLFADSVGHIFSYFLVNVCANIDVSIFFRGGFINCCSGRERKKRKKIIT